MTQSSSSRRIEESANLPWKSLPASARAYYRASTLERIAIVKRRVPAAYIETVARSTEMSKERLYLTLGLARATIDRKVRNQERLSPDESERIMSIANLIAQAEAIVQESGNQQGFDAAKWVGAWLDKPHPALGGRCPGEFMDTADGRILVSQLLGRMQSSAYT